MMCLGRGHLPHFKNAPGEVPWLVHLPALEDLPGGGWGRGHLPAFLTSSNSAGICRRRHHLSDYLAEHFLAPFIIDISMEIGYIV